MDAKQEKSKEDKYREAVKGKGRDEAARIHYEIFVENTR